MSTISNRDKMRQIIAREAMAQFPLDQKLTDYQANAMNFLTDMAEHIGPLTDRQQAWLLKLAQNILPATLRWDGKDYELTPELLEKII